MLMYLRNMSILAMQASGGVLGLATRPDVTSFHKRVLNAGIENKIPQKNGEYDR
ncbi:hypothetical protein J2Y67_002387 [Neobacillus niacini]|nr:hypothetical protein [Neobacillus niacini]